MCNWNSSSEKVLRVYVVQPFRPQCIYEIRISYNTLFPRGRIYGPRNESVGIGLAIIFSDSLADFASSHKILALRDGSSKPKNRYILARQHRIVLARTTCYLLQWLPFQQLKTLHGSTVLSVSKLELGGKWSPGPSQADSEFRVCESTHWSFLQSLNI